MTKRTDPDVTKRVVSQRPRAARGRARRAADRIDRSGAELERDIAIAYKPLEEWDWEELSRGRPRNPKGGFTGPKPAWVTVAIQAEIQSRMKRLTEEQVMSYGKTAVETMISIMQNEDVDLTGKPEVPASVRLQAAQYVVNRILGTPTAKADVTVSNPLQDLMGSVLVNPDGAPAHPIIEGVVVEDDSDLEGDGGE